MRRRFLLLAGLATSGIVAGWVALAQVGAPVNTIPGSVWTYLGPTFGASWVAPQAFNGNTPEVWGGIGDGLANDTAAVLACFTASVSGFSCILRNGRTYLVDSIAIPPGTSVVGGGTLKRLPNSANTTFLHGDCVNLYMQGITIDGNKANQTVAASNLVCTNYRNTVLVGVTSKLAKGGDGVRLDKSVDEAAQSRSRFDDLFLYSNDGNGMTGLTAAWQLQLTNTTATHNGFYGAYFGPTGPANNIDATLKYITVSGGDFSYNGTSGLAAAGFISGWVGDQPTYGPGIEPVFGAKFTGVTAVYNGYYGIVFQAKNSILSDSTAAYNAAAGTFGGGVLGNGEHVEINNVVSVVNGPSPATGMGIDIGCGISVHVNGGNYSGNNTGINAGCSQFSSIRNTTITSNPAFGIFASAAEIGGDGYGIPGYTQQLIISDNRIACPTNDRYGIVFDNGGLGIEISNNYIQGCFPTNAIVAHIASAKIQNNVVPQSNEPFYLNAAGVDFNATAGASGILYIPSWADTVAVYGVNNIHSIKLYDETIDPTGVYSARFDNGGSGYTAASTAVFTGCTTPPTGSVRVTRAGVLTGFHFDTYGSGCVNPTVSFTGGTGAVVGLYAKPMASSFQKDLTVLVAGGATLTITGGGNLNMTVPLPTGLVGGSTVKFHWGYFAGLYETSRSAR